MYAINIEIHNSTEEQIASKEKPKVEAHRGQKEGDII